MTSTTANDDLGFDPDELKARYRAERDKRLRHDGNDQYIEIKGRFGYFVDVALGEGEGKPEERAAQSAPYGGLMGAIQFWELLKRWRDDGKFEGLEFETKS